MGTERNLLYGILTWRAGLVSRDDLLRAVEGWAHDPNRPLGDVMVDSQILAAERRPVVDQLLDEHLARHAGDAAACLASLDEAAELREELGRIVQDNGSRTLPQLSGTLPAAATPPDDQSASDETAAASAMRFRILRPHAKGALGEVFVARDDELNREVALKRIRDHHVDTPQNRARFLLEAEVTGGLEHPGIVPVYSLGTSDDGRPFYAMRFIKGRSLREAIEHYHSPDFARASPGARLLELRQLLDRFMAVCNAIEYAHSRGVLHRDLKPENIMLGAYAETLVVDWGLAKPLSGGDGETRDADRLQAFDEELPHASDAATDGDPAGPAETLDEPVWRPSASTSATQMGSAIGTPAYMSPEQAAGRLDDISRASDVYSLGATLYCLLTGRPPFNDSELGRLLDRVRRGDFPPPRAVNRGVPAALEAVCLKAMALEPAERYATPQELAGDIERWLADEPVSAYGAPWHERLAHWARRHRRGVQSAVAALAVVSVVSVVAALAVHAAKQQVEQERAAEREAKNEARRAIDNFVNLVTEEEALNDEHVRHLRRRLLADALKYYEELIDKHGGEEHLRHDLASAILRVGKINHETGSKAEALKAFQEALKLFQDLARQHPDHEQYQSELALGYRGVGQLEGELNRRTEALEDLRQAVEIQQRLVDRASDHLNYRRDLGLSYFLLGNQEAELKHDDPAREHLRLALDLRRQLAEAEPDRADLQSDLAASYQGLAIFHAKREQWQPARDDFQESLAIRRQLTEAHPSVARYQADLAGSYNSLGTLNFRQGEPAQAGENYLAALKIRKRLADDHPTVTEYQHALAVTCKNLGGLETEAGDWPAALGYFEQALVPWQRLVDGNPAVDRYQIELGDAWYDLGQAQAELGSRQDALESFRKASKIKQDLAARQPDNSAYRSALGAALANVARALHAVGENDEARDTYQQAIAEQRRAFDHDPKNARFRELLAQHYQGLAKVERAAGHDDAAADAEERARSFTSGK